jgi:hypothetical protein
MHIGIDIDNTTLNYSASFRNQVALSLGVDLGEKSKSEIQAFVLQNYGGSVWTSLQGLVYSKNPLNAVLFDGFEAFLTRALIEGAKVTFVSHKTKHPVVGPKVDIRTPVVNLMHDLIVKQIPGLELDLHFCETLEEKVLKIQDFNFDYFIDDLASVLKGIQPPITGLHFSCRCATEHALNHEPMNSWADICSRIFGGD